MFGRVVASRNVVLLGLAAALSLALSTASIAAAAYPGSNGRIIFTNNQSNPRNLWSVRPDGTGVQLLTTVASSAPRAFVSFPSVSADGSKIAVMLTEFFDSPVPCGGLDESDCSSVVLMDGDGSNQRVVFKSYRIATRDVALSPDGTRVALTLTNKSGESVYSVQTDGTKLRRLAASKHSSLWITDTYGRWSPDGQTISLESNRDSASTGSSWSIYTATVKGGKVSRVLPGSNANDLEADWSPDGQTLVFIRTFAPSDYRIMAVNRDGTDLHEVVRDFAGDQIPAFSPDGRQIAYLRSGQVWLVDSDGNNPHALVTGGSLGFAWVPLP